MGKKPKPLLHTLQGTGTPNGQSRIRELANGCPRRWYLGQMHQDVRDDALVIGDALMIGSVLHAFMELYYSTRSDRWSAAAVKFTTGPSISVSDAARREGERLFRAYRAVFPPREVGRVVAIEKLLPEGRLKEVDGQTVLVPAKKAQAQRVYDAVGFPGYSARLDLVTKLSGKDVTRIRKTRHVNLRGPGYYAWDWKTAAFMTARAWDSYRDSIQFLYYQAAWNAAFPARELKGLIVCIISKTTKPSFDHVFVPAPRKAELAVVRDTSRRALKVLEEQVPPYECNSDACYDWHRQCAFLGAGLCRRH